MLCVWTGFRPCVSAREKREYNAWHAGRMKPLRERRGRLHRLIKTGGMVDEVDVEREDIQEEVDGGGRRKHNTHVLG